jgi:ABC-type Na+ efflux pump permease subunit
MIRKSFVIAFKDLRGILREKTFVSIILLLIFVASFASVLTFGILILYNPYYVSSMLEGNVKIAVVGNAPVLQSVVGGTHYDNLENALNDFYSGEIDAVVWLHEENVSGFNFVKLFLPKEELKAVQTSIHLKKKLIEYQDKLRKMRGLPESAELLTYNQRFERIEIPEGIAMVFKFKYMLLIPLLMITTAVVASGLLIDLFTEERETGTLNILLTVVKREEIITGKIIASLILPVFLTPIWLALLILNGVEIESISYIVMLTYSVSFMFISISSFIVTLFKDRERSQLVFSLLTVGLIPLFFSHPFMPASLVTRVAAGSEYGSGLIPIYFILSIMLLLVAVRTVKID